MIYNSKTNTLDDKMVQFAKPSNGPQNDCGRINLLIDYELGPYQNIIKKWIAKLEENGKKIHLISLNLNLEKF